ncbi:MAG: Glycosyltransferase involved in cell wall bisynthesis [Candidatus Electronema aureum]|uniref:Glycosyltransferase involved in cell wall bisynthesis n=1 Tax=Candidatus Electronema aureum TaxID=2005002 RepID=A0A521G0P3_9BACT|nr:MAG: Glycosyltransferase involved in cell wall bisynthesis [Candidatus Electronema aureum]
MIVPKLSIVTPSFNQGEFIEETIKSVLQQNYKNIEYIVIDGGSSDNSVDIIKKYENKLHFWISEKDEGHGHAINKGFSHTSGEIMAWINSDDKYTPWSFNVVAEIFSNFPHVMWIVGFNSWWNSTGAMTTASRCPKNIFDFLLGNYGWIQQESVFWRRELWEKAGGYINQNYKLMVDGELWTRFFLHEELYSVDCILSGYRMHNSNRAKLYYSNCLEEMNIAISLMKSKCSINAIDIYRKIKLLEKIKRFPFILRFFDSSIQKNAGYKNIIFEDGLWRERIIPFSF